MGWEILFLSHYSRPLWSIKEEGKEEKGGRPMSHKEPSSIQLEEEKEERAAALQNNNAGTIEFATTSFQQSRAELQQTKPLPPFPQRFEKQHEDKQFK